MPSTKKGTKKIAQNLAAYKKAGTRVAVHAAAGAYEAFMDSPPNHRSGDRAWTDALKLVRDNKEAWAAVDSAHGHAMADLSEEAFLTGFFAGLAVAKAGVR